MSLLDIPIVSDVFLNQLQADLDEAELIRFSVAYISDAGLNSIGTHRLAKVLRHEKSFGVASLTCANGYDPLYDLQQQLGDENPRLKYFMEPMVPDPETGEDVRLLHTKLIYLARPSTGKAVVYIGSHNWSARAVGPYSPRNGEASLRLEQEFLPDDLEGTGRTLGAAVNAHLLNCYGLPACLFADSRNVHKFQEWVGNYCNNQAGEGLEKRVIILAVHSGGSPTDVSSLEGRSVYAQIFEEEEGRLIPERGQKLFLLLWDSQTALHAGEQPTLLICHVSTSNPGANSSVAGTNRADNAVAGFAAVLFDRTRLQAEARHAKGNKGAVRMTSGLQVDAFDFEFPASSSEARTIDAGTRPTYQFLLEVDHVVLPEGKAQSRTSALPGDRLVWSPEQFGISEKSRVDVVKSPGFQVDEETEQAILNCLRDVFQVDPQEARVKPYSKADDPRVGLKLSDHPLHDLLKGTKKELANEFFEKLRDRKGMIVPDRKDDADIGSREGIRLKRTMRVFSRRLARLLVEWRR